jgi:hypothetical protein
VSRVPRVDEWEHLQGGGGASGAGGILSTDTSRRAYDYGESELI